MRRDMGLIVTLISLSAIMACFVGYSFFYASGYEILMITGESMRPTLNKGDLVIVETGYRVGQIYAHSRLGDIICFHNPDDPDELITHRAAKTRHESNFSFIITKGDNNDILDSWHVSDNELVGKVVALNSPFAWIYVTSLMWIAVIVVFVIVSVVVYVRIVAGRNKEKKDSARAFYNIFLQKSILLHHLQVCAHFSQYFINLNLNNLKMNP